ncbi:MAG: hypothetical protein OEU74_03700 [Gammaproteobacteria bacterium]|jgi:hypothetical protein|nr:hypothetical protein [Gammaproteobacteria bacterium]
MHKLVNYGLVVILLYAPSQLMAQDATVKELEQRCEEMRENRIRPLREAEIEKCKADKTKDPAWCERYYKDYGNATRGPEGKYTPRMFDNLPPCVQAREKKAATRSGTVPSVKRSDTTTDVDKTIKQLTTSPEDAAAASQGKVTPISRDSTLETEKRETEKPEPSRESTLPDESRDSTSGTSTR